jgi:hypothetical protein
MKVGPQVSWVRLRWRGDLDGQLRKSYISSGRRFLLKLPMFAIRASNHSHWIPQLNPSHTPSLTSLHLPPTAATTPCMGADPCSLSSAYAVARRDLPTRITGISSLACLPYTSYALPLAARAAHRSTARPPASRKKEKERGNMLKIFAQKVLKHFQKKCWPTFSVKMLAKTFWRNVWSNIFSEQMLVQLSLINVGSTFYEKCLTQLFVCKMFTFFN